LFLISYVEGTRCAIPVFGGSVSDLIADEVAGLIQRSVGARRSERKSATGAPCHALSGLKNVRYKS
jgi:hypothetical protein